MTRGQKNYYKPYVPAFDATDALCAQTDPDSFFPMAGEHYKARFAVQVCAECPIIASCLVYAIKSEFDDGIWGGAYPRERMAMRRDHKKIQIHLNTIKEKSGANKNTGDDS